MPLSSAIEFLAAQQDAQGSLLVKQQVFQVSATVPGNSVIQFNVTPGPSDFMTYGFRLMVDPALVPGSMSVQINQWGFQPFFATLTAGVLGVQLDYFLRITRAHPSLNTAVNLSNLPQRFILYVQTLPVPSEAVYNELERRMARYFGQVPSWVHFVPKGPGDERAVEAMP